MVKIIGLSGYAQSGKDTFARILAEDHGFSVAHFADALREACRALNPIVCTETGLRWAEAEEACGYEVAKADPCFGAEFRGVLQRLGTDVARDMFGQNVWVDAALAKHVGGSVVYADVRFPNEADAIYEAGGVVGRITRPGRAPVNGHVSEIAMDGYPVSFVVANDRDMSRLRGAARGLLELANSPSGLKRGSATPIV
jgi:hypothetical protein